MLRAGGGRVAGGPPAAPAGRGGGPARRPLLWSVGTQPQFGGGANLGGRPPARAPAPPPRGGRGPPPPRRPENPPVPPTPPAPEAPLGAHPGVQAEPEPELRAREATRGAGRGEPAHEGPGVGRRHCRARTVLLARARGAPLDMHADGGGNRVGTAELEGVDDRHVADRQHRAAAVTAEPQRVTWRGNGPEQPRRQDATVEVVHVRARPGLEEVNSYEGEGAVAPGAIGGDVGALVRPDVGLEVVLPAVAPRRSPDMERDGREPP